MTLVSTVTVGSGGAASIDFTSIPATATDLVIVLSGRSTFASSASAQYWININSDTGGNYSRRYLEGDGSTAYSYSSTGATTMILGRIPAALATSSTFGNACIYIPNYTVAVNKSVSADSVVENNAGSGTSVPQTISANQWANTGTISTIVITTTTSLF
jgi:N-acetylmuramoyl-L-alanine amidase